MRIFEANEVNYSIDDILDAITDELGFSAIKGFGDSYTIKLTSEVNLTIDFEDEISIFVELPEKLDISQGLEEVETTITALESVIEIEGIIQRMTIGEESFEEGGNNE